MTDSNLRTDQSRRVTSINLGDKSGYVDVDEVVGQHADEQQQRQQQSSSLRSNKLKHANEVAHKTETELRALCEGLNNRVLDIGMVVSKANQYQGSEKVIHLLGNWGKHRADAMRHDRLQALNLDQAVREIEHYVVQTIQELGESETEYKLDLANYQRQLDIILVKNREANPRYLDVKAKREKLEAEVSSIEEELKSGTLDQRDRPAKEELYENKKRELDAAKLEETTTMAVVKEAQEAIPEIQKSRDSAASAIQSLHGMRQSMLEKFANFKVVLERATTAMKARARLELYESTDPAFNKSLELITENNVATAGAAMDVMIERIKHAAIDPDKSQALLQELLANMTDFAAGLTDIEGGVEKGTRVRAVK